MQLGMQESEGKQIVKNQLYLSAVRQLAWREKKHTKLYFPGCVPPLYLFNSKQKQTPE